MRNDDGQQQFSFLDDIPTADEELTRRVAAIQGLSSIQIKPMIDALEKERAKMRAELNKHTKQDNTWVYEA